MFCHLGHFFSLLLLLKGRSLRCSPGRGNAGRCTVTLYVGEGPGGSSGACFTLLRISILHPDTHNQTGPRWYWFSPTTSPVRLGVPPAAAPTPTGVFNQRFEALFPRAVALGCMVCFAPLRPVYLCSNVGLWVCYPHSACPALRHSESGPLGLSVGMWGRRVC